MTAAVLKTIGAVREPAVQALLAVLVLPVLPVLAIIDGVIAARSAIRESRLLGQTVARCSAGHETNLTRGTFICPGCNTVRSNVHAAGACEVCATRVEAIFCACGRTISLRERS